MFYNSRAAARSLRTVSRAYSVPLHHFTGRLSVRSVGVRFKSTETSNQEGETDSKPQLKVPEMSHEQRERMRKKYEMTQRASAIVLGVATLAGMIAAFEIYNNWAFIKHKILGLSDRSLDSESFDKLYEDIQNKKLQKQKSLDQETYNITNKNDSSVPGVYICGNNQYGLVNPSASANPKKSSISSANKFQTIFKRLDFFDGVYLKDLSLGEKSGVAIDQKGDLYQWGAGFDGLKSFKQKTNSTISLKPTLKGEKLVKAQLSNGMIYLLKSNGDVIYLPETLDDQKEFAKNAKSKRNWKTLYLTKSTNAKPFAKLSIPHDDKITDISSGKEHLVLLSKKGLVYSMATGIDGKPETSIKQSMGQFGIPTLSQFDKPPKQNKVYEVTLLNKYVEDGKVSAREITQISAGDYFTMCLDNLGYIWTFGKNTYGSLGKPINYNSEIIPYPVKVDSIMKHFGKSDFPQAINIAAGGQTAYATYVTSNIYHLFEKSFRDTKNSKNRFTQSKQPLSADNLTDSQQNSLIHFSWGHGLKGELGIGHFIHGQAEPHKMKSLNDIKGFNEITNKNETTGIKNWSIGSSHAFVTLDNNDVYCWGDNEFGQLGNGKRIRLGAPAPLISLKEPSLNNNKDGNVSQASKKGKLTAVNDRLQLTAGQTITCGVDTTAIYYKKP